MLLLLYHSLWTLILLLGLPFLLLSRNSRLPGRLALTLPKNPPRAGALWVHALSVGEVLSALPLIKALREKYPQKDIVLTITTRQGMEVAGKYLKGKLALILLPMPLDFWWSMRRMIRFIRPAIFILVETDLWPGLLLSLKRRGIRTLLVNGRISPRTFRWYRRFRPVIRPFLKTLERHLMQTDLDTERLLETGVGADKVLTAGNIKYDQDWTPMEEREALCWINLLSLNPRDTVWVAGSTHEGEEEILLQVFKELRASFPQLRLILAPRRIERSEAIRRIGREMGLTTILRTDCELGATYDVLLLNTLGELGRVYGIGKIGYVGGSLVPIGGHNLLEPASFGCPVLFGPHTFNFELMSQRLIEAGGGIRVRDARSLSNAVRELLDDPKKRRVMGQKSRAFVTSNQGAVLRILEHIDRSLS